MFLSPYIVDSFVALTHAYQETLDEDNYDDGSIFRERVYIKLVDIVAFDGLSGLKSFNSFGDLNHPVLDVLYVGLDGEFVYVGSVNDTANNVNTSLFYWPDGTQGMYESLVHGIYFDCYHHVPGQHCG